LSPSKQGNEVCSQQVSVIVCWCDFTAMYSVSLCSPSENWGSCS